MVVSAGTGVVIAGVVVLGIVDHGTVVVTIGDAAIVPEVSAR